MSEGNIFRGAGEKGWEPMFYTVAIIPENSLRLSMASTNWFVIEVIAILCNRASEKLTRKCCRSLRVSNENVEKVKIQIPVSFSFFLFPSLSIFIN